MAKRVSAGLRPRQGRRFGLTLGTAFVALAALLWWKDREAGAVVTASIGVMLVAAGIAAPTTLLPVERAWMAFARAISKITTPLIMGAVYFLVIFPIGVLVRLFKGSPLEARPSDGSFWVSRSREEGQRGGMRRQF